MAHLIDLSNNRANIAFVGETPWHGLGSQLPEGATIETWCKAAGLDYVVEKAPVFAQLPGENVALPNKAALYRTDTGAILGDASFNRYNIVQPAQVLEFFRDLIADHGFVLDVAGALKGGARVWAMASNRKQIRVMGTDIVRPYLTLSTGFDGVGTEGWFNSVRVVCNNTLQMALTEQSTGGLVKVRHSAVFDATQVKAQLGIAQDIYAEFEDLLNKLAEKKMTKEQNVQVITELFASYDDDDKKFTEQSRKVMREVWTAVHRSPGSELRSAQGTAWGLVNGVTNFLDYSARARSRDNRLQSAWFGKGRDLKAQAVSLALAA